MAKTRKAVDIINSPSFQNAVQAANSQINSSNKAEQKPTTWEDIMKERRKELVKEKTDAQKMQRYHALTDVFNAFGRMGGAAVGGAIGGDALVGASAKEYQPNRGYLDAIEKAKAANDRIRALDDTGFQFQLNKQLRDEQREYEDKLRTNQWAREDQKISEQRDYEDKVRQIEMDFRSQESLLQRRWEEAMRSKNFEEQAKLEKELLKLRNDYESNLITLKSIYGGTDSGSKLKKITVNGKEYTIDPSNAVSVSEIYNMIPVPEGGLPYGKAFYWDGEIVGRDNPTLDEMLVAIGQNVNNEGFISAFENRFGSGNNGGIGGQTSDAQGELNEIING